MLNWRDHGSWLLSRVCSESTFTFVYVSVNLMMNIPKRKNSINDSDLWIHYTF